MARGELLRKLFQSYNRSNDKDFRAVALEIIAEEQKKKNYQLAKDLLNLLENSSTPNLFPRVSNNFGTLPKDRERQTLLIDVRQPDRQFTDIILSAENKKIIQRTLDEFRRAELLRTHGLIPKSKLLFCGPPGCGKTFCAEIISREIGLPLLYTRFDAIISSFLGETAANLRKVFDYAATGRWVVFFDEFDAIGKERDDPHEHGELKRVVNSFLQLLDNFHASSLVIAATNHEQLLDPALWRRFDEIIYFPLPSLREIQTLLSMKFKNYPHKAIDFRTQASRMKGMSYADVERVCLDAIKICIIEDQDHVDQKIFDEALKRQKMRLQITKKALDKKIT
ncbi:MAG: ATP-binding protein [Deltaproteobacteria bacterium]|nr:ATP-binding protein [Deltaproteobacteria bacterium]